MKAFTLYRDFTVTLSLLRSLVHSYMASRYLKLGHQLGHIPSVQEVGTHFIRDEDPVLAKNRILGSAL